MNSNFEPVDLMAYTDKELDELARALGRQSLQIEYVDRLQRALGTLQFLFELETEQPGTPAKERLIPLTTAEKEALKKVLTKAKSLKEALTDERLVFIDSVDWPLIVREIGLERFVTATQAAIDGLPCGGPRPKRARATFLKDLAHFYFDITGKRPKRSHDAAEPRDTGKFLEFAKIALSPFPTLLTGVDDAVRNAIDEFNSEHSFAE